MPFIEILREHVKTPFLTAFAYGSGVFKQHGGNLNSKKMIDYLVVVEDNALTQWHEHNSLRNPGDYPLLGKLAVLRTDLFKEAVYYVPDVRTRSGERIKYGVVGWNVLIRDLFTWNSLFLAGRLHKPTLRGNYDGKSYFSTDSNADSNTDVECELRRAMEYNWESALRYGLLTSKNPRDFRSVMRQVVGLSYTQDPRLLLAESPDKIENILRGQWTELERIYLAKYEDMMINGKDPGRLIANLPICLKQELPDSMTLMPSSITNSIIFANAVGRIVKRAAWRQVALGAISTSPIKSAAYLLAKMKKRFSL